MSSRVVSLADLGAKDLGLWRELSDLAVEPNPFFDPDFVLPAATALGERDQVGLLVVEDGGGWSGLMPVRRHRRWHRIPLPAISTWRHRYCFLGTPLLRPDREADTLAAMITTLAAFGGSGFAAFEWVSAEGRVRESLEASLPSNTFVFEEFHRAAIARRPQDDYLEGWVKSKDRRELRRRSRLLGEELGGTPDLADRAGDPEAVERFLTMEAAGWKGEAGTALASDPGHAQFFREVTTSFSDRECLNLVFLEAGGSEVAATCDLVAGGTDFCFKVAYDESLGKFAPGRDLTFRMVDYFHADESLRTMDSCTAPDNDLYNRMWPDRRLLRTFVIEGAGARGRLSLPLVRLAAKARNRRG